MSHPHHERVRQIAAAHSSQPGGLLPALHAIQHEFGWVVPGSVEALADAFNLSAAEVHGVVTFYKDFRTTQPHGPIVQVCRAEACQAVGAEAVLREALRLADGAAVEVEEVFCLGNCALGPSGTVDGRLVAHLSEAALAELDGRWRS